MSRFPDKPSDTVIQEREEIDGITLFWKPPGAPRWLRYLIAAFLVFWLCGWLVGLVTAFGILMIGVFQVFLAAWLGCWTVGGLFAIGILWVMLRPDRPESVTIRPDSLRYDPGTSLLFVPNTVHREGTISRNPNPMHLFRPPKPIELSRSDAKPFKLERVGERQRLTFDHGAERIEIGLGLREPEREWLHAVLESWRVA